MKFTWKRPSFQLPQYLKVPFLISLLNSSILALTVLVMYWSLQPIIPLFYSLAQSNDFLVDKSWIAVFPIVGFGITFGHLALVRQLFHHERIIPLLFAWVTVVLQLLLALAFWRIIILIT